MKWNRFWQKIRREQGQSLVELALILPFLLLLFLGTVDVGKGFKNYIALTNATREGARWITIHPTDQAGARARIRAEATRIGVDDSVFSPGGYTVSFSPDQSNYAAGEKVTLNLDYQYELLFGAITGLPELHLTASTTMVVLYDE